MANRGMGDISLITTLRTNVIATLNYDEKPTTINSLQLILIQVKKNPSS
jgi:hypothetical protein